MSLDELIKNAKKAEKSPEIRLLNRFFYNTLRIVRGWKEFGVEYDIFPTTSVQKLYEQKCFTFIPSILDPFQLAILKEFTKTKISPRALDIGSGLGNILALFQSLGYEATGIEGNVNYYDATRFYFDVLLKDVSKFKKYNEFDLIYIYTPLYDQTQLQKLYNEIYDQISTRKEPCLFMIYGTPIKRNFDSNWEINETLQLYYWKSN